jgi:DNA phosphorothioation-dependent restriction protein DptH
MKKYEQFLVGVLSSWCEEGNCQPGKRFHYQFSDPSDSARLYSEMVSAATGVIDVDEQKIPFIDVANTKLIFVRHADRDIGDKTSCYGESYISMLRDKVAGQAGKFDGVAMLILHNSLLDTLLGTSEDLKLNVWSHDNIFRQVGVIAEDLIEDKPAVGFILEFQSQTLKDEGSSIFGLRGLYETVANRGIFDLRPLGFLPDLELMVNWSGNDSQAKRRLQKNKELKDRIDHVLHHYPDEVAERLPEFGEKFVKKHISVGGDWAEQDYSKFAEEIRVNAGDTLSFSRFHSELGCECIGPRIKGESAAQRRDMHIICILKEGADSFIVHLEFDTAQKNLKDEEIHVWGKDGLKVNASIDSRSKGKQTVTLKFDSFDGRPTYERVRLLRDNTREKYSFSFLILRSGDFNLQSIQNSFLILPQSRHIALQTKETKLELNQQCGLTVELKKLDEIVDVSNIGILDYSELYESSDTVSFGIKSGEHVIKFHIEGETNTQSLGLPLLLDQGRFGKLFNDDYNGEFFSQKRRVVIDNSEATLLFDRLDFLIKEETIIVEKHIVSGDSPIEAKVLAGSYADVHDHYLDLLKYCEDRKTTPSLSSWGPEFCRLVRQYILSYEKALNSIVKGTSLTADQRQLMQVGFSWYNGVEFITPFHPLVLSYYLYLVDQITGDQKKGSFKNLPSVTTSRLNAKGLLPYVFEGESDFGFTQPSESNMFWLSVVPQEESSYSYVSKLVLEKIDEFSKTFKDLFNESSTAPLVVNSVNNGPNKEFFLGVLDYFKKYKLKSQSIHINIYGSEDYTTEFEEFAEMGSYDQIKQRYNFKGNEESDQVIDLLRTKVSFSKFSEDEAARDGHQWCHISFFKNVEKISPTSHNLDEHTSGIACDGILSGESSFKEGENYYTAFGMKRVDDSEKHHLKIARLVNNLLRPARQVNESYWDTSALRLAVNERFKAQLEVCYKNSLWTTIIDPKVTLNFFQHEQGLILIHYSDQYTNSSGYDAVTVTSHADLYDKMLSSHGKHLLREFNAFNGEWLLKMVSANNTTKLERKGIIGTWKLVCGLLAKSEISWIPLSIAEMVRVSGNIGLKLSGSDFSRHFKKDTYNGKMSDDILFVGFKGDNMFLLPVEVKTGQHGADSMAKACGQVEALRDYLVEGLLGLESFEGRIYRSLFIRQVLMQVEKYQLYDVFPDKVKPEKQFKHLLNQREEFLSGDYTIAELVDYPEGLAVGILSNDSCVDTSSELKGNVLQIEIPDSYLNRLLSTPVEQLSKEISDRTILNLSDECYLTSDVSRSINKKPSEEPKPDYPEIVVPIIKPDVYPVSDPRPVNPMLHDRKSLDSVTKVSGDPLSIKFGEDVKDNDPILWEPTNTSKVFNTNTGIIGTMGTGKTQFTKSLITQLIRNQKDNVGDDPIGVLIFDYKADYIKDDFVEATGAKVFELFELPFNPFSLFGKKPMLPIHTANLFRSTMGNAYGLGVKQQNKIRTLVIDAYEAAGIYPSDPETWSRPAPTLNDVWNIYCEDENLAQDSLYAALDDLIRFKIFESDSSNTISLYDLLNGVVVINLSGYDPQIQNLIVAITLDVFYSQMHHLGSSKLVGDYRQISKMILVDEADNFMSQEFESLKKILKEGREFGVGTILSTQELTHFKTSNADYSSYILTWIIHRVSQIKNQDVKSIFNASDKHEENALMQKIRELDKHYSLYVDGDKKITKMKDLAFWQLKKYD